MARKLETVLDECLRAMARGATVEECLRRYPQQANDLRPLLEAAARVQQVVVRRPRRAAMDAGRAQFLSRAAELRRRKHGVGTGYGGFLRAAAVAAALLIVVGVSGGATVTAASRSLPSSPLYPVKLGVEQAQVWFTFDEQSQADLLLRQSQKRIEEIRALQAKGQPVSADVLAALYDRTQAIESLVAAGKIEPEQLSKLEDVWANQEAWLINVRDAVVPHAREQFAQALAASHNSRLRAIATPQPPAYIRPQSLVGGLTQWEGQLELRDGSWTIGGISVVIDDGAIVEGGDRASLAGRTAQVTVAHDEQGRLRALLVALRPPEAQDRHFRLVGTVEEVGDDYVQVGGSRINIDLSTIVKGRLHLGQVVDIRGLKDASKGLRAATVEAQPTQSEPFVYEGPLEGIRLAGRDTAWTVGGEIFRQAVQAVVDARVAAANRGVRARVEGVHTPDGFVTTRVRLLGFNDQRNVRMEGRLQSVEGDVWQVSGFTVVPPADVQPPAPGTWIAVEGQRDNGRIMATAVQPEAQRSKQQVLEGILTSVGQTGWVVGGTQIQVTSDTVIHGTPFPGAAVSVRYRLDDDGRPIADEVQVWSKLPIPTITPPR